MNEPDKEEYDRVHDLLQQSQALLKTVQFDFVKRIDSIFDELVESNQGMAGLVLDMRKVIEDAIAPVHSIQEEFDDYISAYLHCEDIAEKDEQAIDEDISDDQTRESSSEDEEHIEQYRRFVGSLLGAFELDEPVIAQSRLADFDLDEATQKLKEAWQETVTKIQTLIPFTK